MIYSPLVVQGYVRTVGVIEMELEDNWQKVDFAYSETDFVWNS